MHQVKPFGLKIRSDIPLPGVDGTEKSPDVSIHFGPVPESLSRPSMIRACAQADHGRFLLVMDSVARYLVEDGHRITIQPAPGASDDEIRIFLFGSVWSALLLQRGLLPLHGSCILAKEKAVLFSGHSGNGKSTLAAAMMDRGYPMLGDEVCALDISASRPPRVLPGFPQVFLWADSLRKLSRETKSFIPVRPRMRKYILPFSHRFSPDSFPLTRIYILTVINNPSLSMTVLSGTAKFQTLINATYRAHHVGGLGLEQSHFKQCAGLSSIVEVKRLERPGRPFNLDPLLRMLEADLK